MAASAKPAAGKAAPKKSSKARSPSEGSRSATTKARSSPKQTKPLTPWQKWVADPQRALDDLCSEIVQGGNLYQYTIKHGLSYNSVRDWISADSDRDAKYARAREDRSDKLADEIISISDEDKIDVKVDPETGAVVEVTFDSTAVQRNKLRVDSRKWVAAKLKPRVYGEKVQVDANVNVRSLSDEDLAKQLAKFGIQVASKPQGGGDGSN